MSVDKAAIRQYVRIAIQPDRTLVTPVLLRGLPHGFTEAAGEIVAVGKATIKCDIGDVAAGAF